MRGLLAGISVCVASVSLFMTAGCADDECTQNKNSLPLAGFYSSSENPEAISLDLISVFGIDAPGDSLLLDSANVSEVYLPFDLDSDESRFVIRYERFKNPAGHILTDTVTFHYESIPWFSSYGCGVIYKFDIKDISSTHTFIDSVSCPGNIIDNKNIQNIRIYFRTSEEGAEE